MDGVRTLELRGSPRARGQAYGESLRSLIHDAIIIWREQLAAATGRHPEEYLRDFLSTVDFTESIERHTPSLLEEVRGLAQGAQLDDATALAYQLIDEEWCYRRRSQSPEVVARCSSFGICEPASPLLVAQNLDLAGDLDGFQLLLRITEEDGREALVTAYAGVIALNGLNSAGVGVCVNALPQLRSASSGLPVAFVIRALLQRASLAEARRFLASVAHASGQNYVIGGVDGVLDIECSPGEAAEWTPGATRVAHANHPLVNSDRVDSADGEAIVGLDGSICRFNFLETNVVEDDAPVTPDRCKEWLSTPPVCRVPEATSSAISLFATVMEVGEHPVLHVAPGPPSITPFEHHQFAAS